MKDIVEIHIYFYIRMSFVVRTRGATYAYNEVRIGLGKVFIGRDPCHPVARFRDETRIVPLVDTPRSTAFKKCLRRFYVQLSTYVVLRCFKTSPNHSERTDRTLEVEAQYLGTLNSGAASAPPPVGFLLFIIFCIFCHSRSNSAFSFFSLLYFLVLRPSAILTPY